MREYWFVLHHDSEELYAALKNVLDGRAGFHVIIDRRSQQGDSPSVERRTAQVWANDVLHIAEHNTPTRH